MTQANTIGKLLRSLTREDAGQAGTAFAETDFEDLMKSAEFIGNLFPGWVFVLCRYNHPHTPYFSPNAQEVLGYPASQLSRMTAEEYFAHVHPEDTKALQASYAYMRDWFRQSPEPDPVNFRFTLHYRFKSPNHGYQYLADEQHCFRNRSGKRVYFALFKVQSEPFSQMKLEVYQRRQGDFRKLTEYVPRAVRGPVITPREKEVLLGIREGLTSKQIAEKFSVSVFTVRNHRSNIFEKARAQNMVQLIRYAEASGWI